MWGGARLEAGLGMVEDARMDEVLSQLMKSTPKTIKLAEYLIEERESTRKLHRAIRSGLKLAKTGFIVVSLMIGVGCVFRLRATGESRR